MDAKDLDYQCRTFDGWVHPELVKLLIERGHEDEVRREAGQGDWFCARGLAGELDRRGEREAVMALLAPYVGTGWVEAATTAAGFLDGWSRAGEAIDLIRPLAETGDRVAVNCLAGLRAGQGRADDVFALLGPRAGDWYDAGALARLAEGLGRDEQVLELLPVASPDCCAPHYAVELRARLLERQGRVDDALLLLRAHIDGGRAVNVNHVEQAADMLIRHGRLAGVRELAAGRGGEFAAQRLAVSLAARGETSEAVAELRPVIDGGSLNAAALAAQLLAQDGRADEAIEVLRLASATHGNPDWVVGMLADLLAGQGRADEALALADGLAEQPHWTPDEVLLLRARALAASGRRDQAIAEIRSHPDAGQWWVAGALAGLLADNGQPDDAIAVLRQPGCAEGGNRTALAMLLAQEGRVEEAIAVSHVRSVPLRRKTA